MRILSVDDREDNRYLVEVLLKANGYEVVSVSNGAEALTQLRSGRFDLIISDILMPVMDGFQLCRTVKADENLHHIPFVIYTATYTGPQDEEFALKIGAERFLQKPCDPDIFMEAVRGVLAATSDHPRVTLPVPEEEVLKLYSERLVRKLEQRTLQLEKESQARQKAEEILRESEKRFRNLFSFTSVPLCYVNEEGMLTDINKNFIKTFGYTRDDIPTLDAWWQLAYPDPVYRCWVVDTWDAAVQRARNEGTEIESIEYRVTCKNGEERTVVISGAILDDGFLATFFDITKRKQVEVALSESETLFRHLFQYHAAIKLIIDPENGSIVDANEAAVRFYGWPLDQLKQMQIREINTLPPSEIQEKIQQIKKRENNHFEFRHRRADGSLRDVEVYSSSIMAKGRELLHSIVHDITERKTAEAERERLRTAIEQAGESVFITDRKGIIEYVNPFFQTVTGYSREEVIGKNPRILKSGKHEVSFYRELWQTIANGGTWKGRVINKRKDGAFYTEQTTISPVRDPKGEIVNFVAVKRDITEQLKLEAQFQQAQKMESVGRLAGGVAHDYNNMLSVIVGYAELALEKVQPTDPLHYDLEQIFGAGQRSVQITRQLLAFARKQAVVPRILDLNGTVESMLKMLRRLVGEDINLVWLPAADLWPINIDPSQVDQILANLCVNARDAIVGVGRITIETGKATLDDAYCHEHAGAIPGKYILLSVSDNGCGMDQKTLEQIFEPFFTTKEIGRGTGLGLATVYGIVKQNHGFINVYSEPGLGTTFKIYLAKHADVSFDEQQLQEKIEIPKGHGEVILVVEDEPAILTLTGIILEGLGYTVLTASSPEEALLKAEKQAGAIHLLLTDVILPNMNGRDLSQRLQVSHSGLKCLFMSGYTADVIAHSGIFEDGLHFLQKPFSKESLASKVIEALAG